MVTELSKSKVVVDKAGKVESFQLFDITLKQTNGSAPQNYTNCYCYGPAYPP